MDALLEKETAVYTKIGAAMPRVGFIGFGEVAYYMMKGFRKDGLNQLFVYTRSVSDPQALKISAKKAVEIGAVIVPDMEELAKQCDIIISSVMGHVAVETAEKMSQWIKPGQIYVDLNNASPQVKQEAGKRILEKGARFVDVGLLGLPIQAENKALMYACGNAAEDFKTMLEPYGANITVIKGEIGQAAMMKALANIYMKCLQGVYLEFAISAKSAGIRLEDLEPLLTLPVRKIPREKDAGFWIIRGALLAERKKEEMKNTLSMFDEMQVDPVMLKAAIERLERVSVFRLGREFDAAMPCEDYETIIDRMFEIGKETKQEVR